MRGIFAQKLLAKTIDSGSMTPYNDDALQVHFHPRVYG